MPMKPCPPTFLTLVPLAGLLLASASPAQTPAPPAPAADKPVMVTGAAAPKVPLLARAPVRADWTIRLTTDEAAAGNDPRAAEAGMTETAAQERKVRSIDVSKDGQLQTYKLQTRWSDGAREEEWILAGQHVAERAGGKGFYIVGSEGTTVQDLKNSDFPEIAWLDMSYFRGVKTHKGAKVFVFTVPFDKKPLSKGDAQLLMLARQNDPTITASKLFKPRHAEVYVYLDAATQLPVEYNDGTTLRSYAFSPPADARLMPPKEVIDFVNKRQKALQVKLATPPGP